MDFETLFNIIHQHSILFDGDYPDVVETIGKTISIDSYDGFIFTEDNVSNIRLDGNRILFDHNEETFSIMPLVQLDVPKYLQDHSK